MRRLLDPLGGPVVFLLVAALVFAGLGWVTIVALRVERAQREAAARAELENKLRVALWQLDGRVLLQLGVEDGRPFYHYSSADPLAGSTAGPTPLLAAPLPDWMELHVQLDPVTGWESPQVLAPEARSRVALAWPELPLRNDTPERALALRALRDRYPTAATCALLAARDHSIPDDSPPFAAPLFTTNTFQQPVAPPNRPGSSRPLAGNRPPDAGTSSGAPAPFRVFGWEPHRRDAFAENPNAEGPSGALAGNGRAGGGRAGENDRGRDDFMNRAQTIQRASQEAKNASSDPMYGKSYSNSLQNLDPRNTPPPTSALPNGNEKIEGDGKGAPERAKGAADPDPSNKATAERPRDTLTGHLVNLRTDLERRRDLGELGDLFRRLTTRHPLLAAAWGAAPADPPPAEDRPGPPNGTGNWNTTNAVNNGLVPLPVVNIHLGSMRPQWITAADGTEQLVLMRVAKLDNRTVYQGVLLNWARLEPLLKEEVSEQFPGASLVPVKDPDGVAPARAMTALPVQLAAGPEPDPPPAGWTALRIGLLLAWAAAVIACAAVGLSGWSLVDLAERRIRFVSAVTHELRTPLTSLRLYLDLLTSGMIRDEAKRQEYLNTLALESERLHRLVNNVLDFAKLEKRRPNGDLKPVAVGELLDQLRKTWAERLAADGGELIVVPTVPAGLELCTDAAMVQQIVGNLIDNARKYARDAGDRRIWLWAKPNGPNRVTFEVEDRGPGVPVGERKTIFKPFRRGARADAAGGAGLGLALARQWAEVLGGTVAYRPAEGAPGACFRLELPR